jgi:hypothetical protein
MYAYVIQDRIFSNWIKYVLINGQTGSCVYARVCVCACVCVRERERDREREYCGTVCGKF